MDTGGRLGGRWAHRRWRHAGAHKRADLADAMRARAQARTDLAARMQDAQRVADLDALRAAAAARALQMEAAR